jgi:hypothetical protein
LINSSGQDPAILHTTGSQEINNAMSIDEIEKSAFGMKQNQPPSNPPMPNMLSNTLFGGMPASFLAQPQNQG